MKLALRFILIVFVVGVLAIAWVAYGLLKPSQSVEVQTDFTGDSTATFLLLGDQGVGNLRQWQVADAMEAVASVQDVTAVLLLGDNFYSHGVKSTTDLQWRYKFENVYTGALTAVPFFATLGNHDYLGNQLAQIEYDRWNVGSGRWQMPSRDYLHTFGGDRWQALVRVAFIDTGLYIRSPADAVAQLDRLLSQAPPATWTLVVTHTPLVSGNVLAHQPGASQLWSMVLKKHRVHAVVAGHDHNMQFIERAGWPASVIVGVGGKSGQELELEQVEGLQFYSANTGFGVLEANSTELGLRYVDAAGQVLFERTLTR